MEQHAEQGTAFLPGWPRGQLAQRRNDSQGLYARVAAPMLLHLGCTGCGTEEPAAAVAAVEEEADSAAVEANSEGGYSAVHLLKCFGFDIHVN